MCLKTGETLSWCWFSFANVSNWRLFSHANFAACPSVSFRTGLEGLYLAAFSMPASLAEKNESTRRIIQTLVWFTLALIISVYVTDIQYAIALIGGLAALYIFFFPGKQVSYNTGLGYPKPDKANPVFSKNLIYFLCLFSEVFTLFILQVWVWIISNYTKHISELNIILSSALALTSFWTMWPRSII